MSLFTVLKYGNIDLGITSELVELPHDLVSEYYQRMNIDIDTAGFGHNYMCLDAAIQYRVSNDDEIEIMKKVFYDLLVEYKE